jgi:hypothetical protein
MRFGVVLTTALAVWPQPAGAQEPLVLDRYMSASAGTTDLLTVQHEISALEDHLLPLKLGDEKRRLPLLAGIFYRAGKFIGADVPQDHMLLVLGHEVFGHGARLRELGTGRVRYSFDAPPPYGGGGAGTSFSGEFPATPLALLAIEMAGIEAQNTMADSIASLAAARGRLHYREAWLYFETRYLAMTYILGATEHSKEGHDVADFFRSFKKACTPPECKPVTLGDLRNGARLTLADPLLYVSVYGFASSYIAQGKGTSPIPMIPLGRGIRYLPSLGFQMTPYGTEHIFRNLLAKGPRAEGTRRKIADVTLRFGNTGASKPWAIDLGASDVRVFRGIHVAASADIWRQPPILSDLTSRPLKTGAALSATLVLPLRRFTHRDSLRATVTTGFKAAGFIPGEQLGRGVIFRAGVTLAE